MRERNIPWQWTTSIRIGFPPNQMNIGRGCRHFRVDSENFLLKPAVEPRNWPAFPPHFAACGQRALLKPATSMP